MPPSRAPIKIGEPANWLKTIENIRRIRQVYPAPVDSMGCDQAHLKTDKHIEQRFHILISLMLSSQTKDPITWAATQKLKENGLATPQSIAAAAEKDIEDLIYPVGFYRRKAIYLKKVAQELIEKHQGDIPDSLEGLCALPGVGPKMAHLCMQEAWNVNSGIGVDTHVHRIAARLGWVPKKDTKTPEDTRRALEAWLPSDYWREINRLLVGFGQTICTPLRPKCKDCLNSEICPSSSVRGGATSLSSRVKDEGGLDEEQERRGISSDMTAPIEKISKKRTNPLNGEETKKLRRSSKDAKRTGRPKTAAVKQEPREMATTTVSSQDNIELEPPRIEIVRSEPETELVGMMTRGRKSRKDTTTVSAPQPPSSVGQPLAQPPAALVRKSEPSPDDGYNSQLEEPIVRIKQEPRT